MGSCKKNKNQWFQKTFSVSESILLLLFIYKAHRWAANNVIAREPLHQSGQWHSKGGTCSPWRVAPWSAGLGSAKSFHQMRNQPPEARQGDTDRSRRTWQPQLSSAPSSSGTSGEPPTSPSWAAAGAPPSQFYDPCHTCAVTWSFSYVALRARKLCWISMSNSHSVSGQGPACQLWCSNV